MPLLPEVDWHAALPRSPSGLGVVPDAAFERLAAGEIPTEQLLDARIIEGRRGGLRWRDFLRTYPDTVPRPLQRAAALVGPGGPAAFERVREASIGRLFADPFWASVA